MSVKKEPLTEKGVLDSEMKQLMTPEALKELKDLSPTMQQFLLRWLDKRDFILSEQLKEELKIFLKDLYEEDNDRLCKSVANVVASQLAETLTPIYLKLEELATGQTNMAVDIKKIKDDQVLANLQTKEIREKIKSTEQDVETLKEQVAVLEPEAIITFRQEIEDMMPLLRKALKVNSTWNILLRIGGALVLGIFIVFLLFKYWWIKLF